MLQYATDSMTALDQFQQLNEMAKARAIQTIASVGSESKSRSAKYAQSPSASLQNTITSLSASASASGLDLPYMRGQQSYRVSPEVAAKAKQVLQASASAPPMSLSSSLSLSPRALSALQRSLSPSSRTGLSRSADAVSSSVKEAVKQAVASNNYAALAKMSPSVLSAALSPEPSVQLLSRSACAGLPRSACAGPVCQQYKVKGKYRCRANPQYGALASLLI